MTCVFLPFPEPCVTATFLGRPQRFLAAMALGHGEVVLAYCANPGSLSGCLQPGNLAVLWDSRDPTRRRRYTWKAARVGQVWVGTDTHVTNGLVESALAAGLLPALAGYGALRREGRVAPGCRADFVLSGAWGDCLVEVKSAAVQEDGMARFPDSVTERGRKHLDELARHVRGGRGRAAMVYVVQRSDAAAFRVSAHRDPAYAEAFQRAVAVGVEVYALGCSVTPEGITVTGLLPVQL